MTTLRAMWTACSPGNQWSVHLNLRAFFYEPSRHAVMNSPGPAGLSLGALTRPRPARCSCAAQEYGSPRASFVTVKSDGALPVEDCRHDPGREEASGASFRMWRSTLPSRRAIAAKLAARPCAKSSIHWRALAIAIRRASRRSGLIGVLWAGTCMMPLTLAGTGLVQGRAIVVDV